MNTWSAAAVLGLAVMCSRPASAQEPEPPTQQVSLFVIAASRFESNINHDPAPVEDYGVVGGGRITYRYEGDAADLELSYEIGLHRYRFTDRWDRVGHSFRAGFDYDLGGGWDLDLDGEASLGGSTEDRELANVFTIKPRLTYELSREYEVRLTGALRYKRIMQDPTRNATNPYGKIEIRRRFLGGTRLTLGSRFEVKHTPRERSRYQRWTHAGELEIPTWNGGSLEVEVKYRTKNYTLRLIEIDSGAEELRRDRRLIPEVTWTQPLTSRLDLRLDYEYETRASNDFEKEYEAHAVGATMIFRVF